MNPPAVEGFLLGGFIPTCRAQTDVKTAKLEMRMDVLSRRQFIGLTLTIAPFRLKAAAADDLPPLSMAADLHRRALAKRLKQLSKSLHELIGCPAAVNQVISGVRSSWGDSDRPDVVLTWLGSMDREAFETVISEVY